MLFVFTLAAFFLPDISSKLKRRTSKPYFSTEFNITDVSATIIKVDFIGNNIFWVDNAQGQQGVYMSSTAGKYKRRVLRSYIEITGFAIDVERGVSQLPSTL